MPHLPRLTEAAVGGTCMEKVRRTPASLKKMVEIFGMEILHKGRDFDNTVVTISDVNRPALQLVGF